MSADFDRRAGEMLAWSAETGLPLPWSVAEIVAIEDAGHVVDMESGDILLDGVTVGFVGTVIGEATVVALKAEAGEETVR